jgi:hypothetical protein
VRACESVLAHTLTLRRSLAFGETLDTYLKHHYGIELFDNYTDGIRVYGSVVLLLIVLFALPTASLRRQVRAMHCTASHVMTCALDIRRLDQHCHLLDRCVRSADGIVLVRRMRDECYCDVRVQAAYV